MMSSLCRQLAVVILLVALFLAPLTSAAHSLETGMMEDTCACHLLQDDRGHESNDSHDGIPCDSTDGCCDEECCHDSAEPPFMDAVNIGAPIPNRFCPYTTQIPPEVYLAIFVPPEG